MTQTTAPQAAHLERKTLKETVFALADDHGMHELLERLADVSHEQAKIHKCEKWGAIVNLLEQAQRLAETVAPVA